MWFEDYHWHYDYVRLAWDAGFSFERCKFPDLDKSKICLVDIDRIVKERDVATVDRFIPVVIQYILDNDQAKVLDINFVKTFRISQLSVEYLLFCKQYLDNTVVLLKKEMLKLREENQELKQYNSDLEAHMNTLSKHETLVTFKCNICPKVFSSEEYLNAHIKRRHDNNNKNNNLETNKLQMEIKELKERLNNTEKLLQCKNETEKQIEVKEIDENELKINEIQLKFDKFKEQVEEDLRVLQLQKTFYEENYGKLFNTVINTELGKSKTDKDQVIICSKDKEKVDNLTQTEIKETPELQLEVLQNRNVFSFKDSCESVSNNESENKPDIDTKISKFEETIENKVSSALQNIEGQMQTFWNKLAKIEITKQEELPKKPLEIQIVDEPRPCIKPRTKFSQSSRTIKKNTIDAEKIKAELDRLTKVKSSAPQVSSPSILEVKSEESEVTSQTEYDPDEESNIEESQAEKPKSTVKPSTSTLGKHSITSLKNIAANENVKVKLREEIEAIVRSRIQEMGISPIWKGLPSKSYEKAIEIIRHQANITKKTHPNFNKIKQSIELMLKRQTSKTSISDEKLNKKNIHSPKDTPKQNFLSIKYKQRPTSSVRKFKSSPPQKVSINKSFYETDTESEVLAATAVLPQKNDFKRYSDVVNELKSKIDQTEKLPGKQIEETEQNTKGVLKNYPSMGSLAKKKVIFDVKRKSSDDDEPIMQLVGGSTSMASSILDNKHNTKKTNENKNTEIDNISDLESSSI